MDLLIELSASVSATHVASVRNRGGRFVAYRVGNDFVLTTEPILFEAYDPSWCPNPNNLSADAIWINRQFEHTCASFWDHLYSSSIVVLPHLWSAYFLNKAIQNNPRSISGWPYSGNSDKLKLSIFEPNISVVKNVTIPFYIYAEFYKKNRHKVSNIYMYNSLK